MSESKSPEGDVSAVMTGTGEGAFVKDVPPEQAKAIMERLARGDLGDDLPGILSNGQSEGVPQPDPQHITDPSLLVVRRPAENPGDVRIEIIPINGLDPLAVPVLLEYALKVQRQTMGLD